MKYCINLSDWCSKLESVSIKYGGEGKEKGGQSSPHCGKKNLFNEDLTSIRKYTMLIKIVVANWYANNLYGSCFYSTCCDFAITFSIAIYCKCEPNANKIF